MVPGQTSKFAELTEVTESERAAEAFFFVWIKRLIIYLNKTKQPFNNLLQYFRVKVDLWKNSKKNFENLTLDNAK